MKLPEQDWFTIKDLCQRWKVEHAYIERMLQSRKLKGEYREYVSLPFEQRRETISAGELLTLVDMVIPDSWYASPTSFAFTVPPGEVVISLEEVRRFEMNSNGGKNTAQENQKSIDSLLKIIISMAVDGYGYDPNQTKSPTAAEIQKASEKLGISIDVDTVRKWLKKSADFFPRGGENID